MARIPVFYSFHFRKDIFRAQQVRNMGVIDGDAPVSPNDWEKIVKRGPRAIENWIDENMKWKRCVVVLIGEETAFRPWVKYEIKRAWNTGRGLVGVRIHDLKCMRTRSGCNKGPNPFEHIKTSTGWSLSTWLTVHSPWFDPYAAIKGSLASWVDNAVRQAGTRFDWMGKA